MAELFKYRYIAIPLFLNLFFPKQLNVLYASTYVEEYEKLAQSRNGIMLMMLNEVLKLGEFLSFDFFILRM